MSKSKTKIFEDAFNQLYEKLGKDLKSILGTPYLIDTPLEQRETDGKNYGTKWKDAQGREILLQVEQQSELRDFKKTTAWKNNNYYKNEYISTAHPGYVFLLHKEFGNKGDKFTIATYELIEKVAKDIIGVSTLFQPGDAVVLGVSHSRGTKLSKTGAGTVVETDTIEPKDLERLPLNLILYGPPGTGKTYNTIFKTLDVMGIPPKNAKGAVKSKGTWFENEDVDRDLALNEFNALKSADRIVFTTFHQSMSYEDFIEGIKPDLTGGTLGYTVEPGLFKKISTEASKPENEQKNFVIIIDEINRGNIANIFGELITLIEDDKRTTKWDNKARAYVDNLEAIRVKLPYSKDKEPEFGVPGNLYIIGTMNTADRSVEALDSALRRRFSFEEMMPKPELLASVTIYGMSKTLEELLSTINSRIEVLKDREHQIGHSYFMRFVDKDKKRTKVKPEDLKSVFTDKIIPLLQEYFYGDYEKIRLVVGDGFVKQETVKIEFADKESVEDLPKKKYVIVKEPVMKSALETLLNIKEAE